MIILTYKIIIFSIFMMKGYVIHQHGLSVTAHHIFNQFSTKITTFRIYTRIDLEVNFIYQFFCTVCGRYSLNYDNHDNFNYAYMINPPTPNSDFIKFHDNFNIGYILLGNENERENYIYNYFHKEIEKLKNSNKNLTSEKSALNENKKQILKSKNLLEKEKTRLSKEIETLNNNNDKNEKNKIEKKMKK